MVKVGLCIQQFSLLHSINANMQLLTITSWDIYERTMYNCTTTQHHTHTHMAIPYSEQKYSYVRNQAQVF